MHIFTDRYVPLYIDKNDRTIHGWELLECRLIAGYILYLTIRANRLEPSGQRSYRIWRTTPLVQI